jgi:hypothetical protein
MFRLFLRLRFTAARLYIVQPSSTMRGTAALRVTVPLIFRLFLHMRYTAARLYIVQPSSTTRGTLALRVTVPLIFRLFLHMRSTAAGLFSPAVLREEHLFVSMLQLANAKRLRQLGKFFSSAYCRVGWFWTFLHFQKSTPEICFILSKGTENSKKICLTQWSLHHWSRLFGSCTI